MMEPTATLPPEVSQSIETLHSQVETLKRELSQALDVWQSTLESERKEFQQLLAHKEAAWQEQEKQWTKQSQSYEDRLEALKIEFESRLKQAEQNATMALSELDDAWQREKLEWNRPPEALPAPAAAPVAPTAPQAGGPTEETVKALQNQLQQFQSTVASLQGQATQSNDLVNACVQALDYQISVLYDLVQHYTKS